MEKSKIVSFWKEIEQAKRIAIGGHIRPDGDCVGSCMGLYHYIREQFPEKQVQVYLGEFPDSFRLLEGVEQFIKPVKQQMEEAEEGQAWDLFVALDSSNLERLEFAPVFQKAVRTVCIDHHITNEGYAMMNLVFTSSSTAEAIYDVIQGRNEKGEEMPVSKAAAEALYMGIVHDTGVFKHSCTTRHTMEVAGALMERGVDTSRMIDDTFYRKSYVQNQILGQALLNSVLWEQGSVISTAVFATDFEKYHAGKTDLDGIVDQLRITRGVEVAVFAYETEEDSFKFSMRSNSKVDVSTIAMQFGGGGHVRAAGCTISGTYEKGLQQLLEEIRKQL